MSPRKSFEISKFPNTKSKQKTIHQDKEPQMAPESESDAILSQAKTRLPWLVETWLFGDINPRSNMKAANILVVFVCYCYEIQFVSLNIPKNICMTRNSSQKVVVRLYCHV